MTADPSDIYNDSGVTDAVFTSVHVHAPQPVFVPACSRFWTGETIENGLNVFMVQM